MSYEPGDSVSQFTLKNSNPEHHGETVSLDDILTPAGAVVIFECNHCPYVIANIDRMNRAATKAVELGMGYVGINSNDPDNYPADSFENMVKRAEKGMPYAYLHDSTQEVATAWGAQRTPEFFLLDANGVVTYHGRMDDNPRDPTKVTTSELKDAIEAVLEGRTPIIQSTDSIGCSVKWK